MATITPEIRQALAGVGDDPLRIDDPVTRSAYVIIKADVYDRMKADAGKSGLDPIDDDFDLREAYPWVDAVMAEDDASDPSLHLYQDRETL